MTLVVTPTMPMTAAVAAAIVAVTRHVFVVVPIVSHKVDRPTAGVVLRAVLAPVFLVARRHVQVDWRGLKRIPAPAGSQRAAGKPTAAAGRCQYRSARRSRVGRC
jgi:hypothetical protein